MRPKKYSTDKAKAVFADIFGEKNKEAAFANVMIVLTGTNLFLAGNIIKK